MFTASVSALPRRDARTFILMARYPGSNNPTRRALGSYPELTLAEAREKARGWKRLIEKGIDPEIAEEKERQAALRLKANTFAAVAEIISGSKLSVQIPSVPARGKRNGSPESFVKSL